MKRLIGICLLDAKQWSTILNMYSQSQFPIEFGMVRGVVIQLGTQTKTKIPSLPMKIGTCSNAHPNGP